jgi:histidinol phosphatase-like enzyme|tara:strand:- start:9467 stop:9763 length:297 start_codon:yes stop_codon:yes gene_type:complete
MRYIIDIDGTICTNTYGKYEEATPLPENIKKINCLYEDGYQIIYWTARGSTTGIDWTELTTQQLKEWGVRYTELRMRKPDYDLFICDKAVNSETYFGD